MVQQTTQPVELPPARVKAELVCVYFAVTSFHEPVQQAIWIRGAVTPKIDLSQASTQIFGRPTARDRPTGDKNSMYTMVNGEVSSRIYCQGCHMYG